MASADAVFAVVKISSPIPQRRLFPKLGSVKVGQELDAYSTDAGSSTSDEDSCTSSPPRYAGSSCEWSALPMKKQMPFTRLSKVTEHVVSQLDTSKPLKKRVSKWLTADPPCQGFAADVQSPPGLFLPKCRV